MAVNRIIRTPIKLLVQVGDKEPRVIGEGSHETRLTGPEGKESLVISPSETIASLRAVLVAAIEKLDAR
ncbi:MULTISPECIES: hypothetical protein [Microbacterium]|uniref:Uncharacterized protein n=1 Tax=Microbacterium binotii TaxID=462710 RepID=A0ABN3PD93_9MICO|nr:hypothetical protein [Microbacterium sp. BG28]MDY0829120.1 hypothetical protein [Microbacterium sp. BG28]